MKSRCLLVIAVLALAGCGTPPSPGWKVDQSGEMVYKPEEAQAPAEPVDVCAKTRRTYEVFQVVDKGALALDTSVLRELVVLLHKSVADYFYDAQRITLCNPKIVGTYQYDLRSKKVADYRTVPIIVEGTK